jgi:hypothetical protein
MAVIHKLAKQILAMNNKFEDIENILNNMRIHNKQLAEEVLEEILCYFFDGVTDA